MITQPYVNFILPDAGGNVKPISNGTIYIGKEGLDPKLGGNPIYYRDNKGTEVEISSPLYLNMTGVIVDGPGSSNIIKPYTKAPISILILNKNGDTVWSQLRDVGRLLFVSDLGHLSGLKFDSVADMQASVLLQVGDFVETNFYKTKIKQSWKIVTSIETGQYGVAISGGLFAQFIPRENVSPSEFGAGRDESDYSDEIQACFDFAETNGMQVTGHGKYFTAKPLSLLVSFSSFATMSIEPTSDFSGTDVITVGDPVAGKGAGVLVVGLLAKNSKAVANVHGIHLKQQEQHLINCGGIGFDKNLIVGSYSITLDDCQAVNGGTGLSVYGQSFSDECNALIVNGGQFYNNSDYSMFIGDDRLTSTISSDEFFGNKIEVRGATCDQRKVKVDRVIGVKLDVYCEKGGSNEVVGIEAGGSFANSLRGLDVTGFFTDLDYAVKCLGSVSGLKFTGAYMRSIQRSALYLVSDQFEYTYEGNTSVSSFTKGQEVHTGVRSGITGNAWAGKTIDCYDLYNGRQNEEGDHIYPSKKVKSDGITYDYSTSRYRYYKSPKYGVGTVSGNVFKFNNAEDSWNFNGGDAVNFTGTGGALTYILAVNYEAGTVTLDSYSFSGGGALSQQTVEPRAEFSSFQAPTVTDYRDGSVAWNNYTVDLQTTYWVLKKGTWTANL